MATAMAGSFALGAADVVLAVVPMFHANAWGLPYTAALTGAGAGLPGRASRCPRAARSLPAERVTFSAGVPDRLARRARARSTPARGAWDLSRAPDDRDRRRRGARGAGARTGGPPRAAADHVVGHDGDRAGRHARPARAEGEMLPAERHALRMKAGRPGALLELRVRNERGDVPWDGTTMGELEVRGAYVASAYYRPEDGRRLVHRGRLVPHRRHRVDRSAGLPRDPRPQQGPDQVGRRVDQLGGARGRAHGPPGGRGGRGGGGAASALARAAGGRRGVARGQAATRRGAAAPTSASGSRLVAAGRRGASCRPSRAPPPASSSSPRCATRCGPTTSAGT